MWWLRSRTTWGQAWRAVGQEPEAARSVGISVGRVRILVMTGSGALAGLAAANFVMGHKHAFEEGLGRGTGLLGIAAALLGRMHPIGVAVAALVLGFLSSRRARGRRPGAEGAHRDAAGRGRARGRRGGAVGAAAGGGGRPMIDAIFTLAFFAQVLRIAVPYALAAMGGAITERAGVIDLAIEAKLLFGAFAAAAVGHATGSAWMGVLGGIGGRDAVAGVQVLCALRLGADQVIVGVALNVLALGGTRFLLQLVYRRGCELAARADLRRRGLRQPVVWLAILAAIATPIAVARTRWGLRLRAAGDRPDSLVAVGVPPFRPRLAAALVGGALAGAGGAQLIARRSAASSRTCPAAAATSRSRW